MVPDTIVIFCLLLKYFIDLLVILNLGDMMKFLIDSIIIGLNIVVILFYLIIQYREIYKPNNGKPASKYWAFFLIYLIFVYSYLAISGSFDDEFEITRLIFYIQVSLTFIIEGIIKIKYRKNITGSFLKELIYIVVFLTIAVLSIIELISYLF
jgi:hypothetical protein